MKVENTQVFNFEAAIRSMRNPLESWSKSDSNYCFDITDLDCDKCKLKNTNCNMSGSYIIGDNDLRLAQKLIKSGGEHRKFLRMIHVCADFDMPRYWWSEMDTYHFNTKNSCSTMHRLLNTDKPITKDMFVICEEDKDIALLVINRLEELRKEYKQEKDYQKQTRLLVRAKRLLMEGFLQLRTVDTNYEEIRRIYLQRKQHRLKEEWVDVFCKWVESLPYAKELIMYEG